jgi:hypothetical protein
MTKKEREHLEYVEECFDQLRSAYDSAQDEIEKLKSYIEILEKVCHENIVKIPNQNESELF